MKDVIEVHQRDHRYSAAELSYVAYLDVDEFCSVYLDQVDEKPRLRLVE